MIKEKEKVKYKCIKKSFSKILYKDDNSTFVFDKIKHDKKSAKFLSKSGIESIISSIKRKAKSIDTIMKVYKQIGRAHV